MPALNRGALEQLMPVLAAVVRNVDYRQRIGCFDADERAGGQVTQVPAGLENGKRAFETAEVQRAFAAVVQLLLQIFQNGLPASLACGADPALAIWGSTAGFGVGTGTPGDAGAGAA